MGLCWESALAALREDLKVRTNDVCISMGGGACITRQLTSFDV